MQKERKEQVEMKGARRKRKNIKPFYPNRLTYIEIGIWKIRYQRKLSSQLLNTAAFNQQ